MYDDSLYADLVAEMGDHIGRVAGQPTWETYAKSGILGISMPKSYGGRGLDVASQVAAFIGMARAGGDGGILFAMSAQLWSVQLPILTFGTQLQKDSYLPKLISGEIIGAHAATEPNAGSDVFALEACALACDGGYRLSGMKRYITNAPVADLFLVFASTSRSKGAWGITAFLVDAADVVRSENVPKLGLQLAQFGELSLTDVFVPSSRRLGAEGGGAAIFNSSLDNERCFILAPALGLMQCQVEDSVRMANGRCQGGRSIGGYQSVSNRIANMLLRFELGRLAMMRAAELKQNGRSIRQVAPLVKLAISEFYMESSLDAVRLSGASGYLKGSRAASNVADAIGGLIYSGTSDILRNILARSAGVRNV